MTSPPIAPAAPEPRDWLLPDRLALAAAGADFVVEWQVEERIQPFTPPPARDGRTSS